MIWWTSRRVSLLLIARREHCASVLLFAWIWARREAIESQTASSKRECKRFQPRLKREFGITFFFRHGVFFDLILCV